MHDYPTTEIPVGGPARVRPYVTAHEQRNHITVERRMAGINRIRPYLGALRACRNDYTAARDHEGHIRLNQGRGTLVARATDTRAQVIAWRNRSTNPRFIAQYNAALALLNREALSVH